MRFVVVLGFVGLFGRVALAAGPPGDADALLASGIELRRQGRTAEALEMFEKAHAIDPSARVLAQMASAELALRRVVEAELHLEQALARSDSPWIVNARNRDGLEKMLADVQRQVSRLQLTGTPGAYVFVNDQAVGWLPLAQPLHIAPGNIRIEATAPGRRPVTTQIAAVGGEQTVVSLELELLVLSPGLESAGTVVATSPPRTERLDRPAWRKWTGGFLLVVGVAAVATGVAGVSLDGQPVCDPPPGAACERQYDTKPLGWAAIGGGAVAAGAGALLLIWPGEKRTIAAGVRPGGITFSGRF